MKIQIMSDLHIGITNHSYTPVSTDAEVVIIAGDVIEGIRGIPWASSSFPNQIVLYIAGNHEFYGGAYPRILEKLKDAATLTPNVYFLEKEYIDIGEVRFYGATLWTDFDLFGTSVLSSEVAQNRMNDYKKIRNYPDYRKFRPNDSVLCNRRTVAWLERQIDYKGKKIVITHHAPSSNSLEEKDDLSPSYASNMDPFIEKFKPLLWVHGHIHKHSDYWVGDTRIVSNPRGYPKEDTGFIQDLVIEI